MKDDAEPFCVTTPRRITFAYRAPLQKLLKKRVAQDFIEPVSGPSEWCHPIVVEQKKDQVDDDGDPVM